MKELITESFTATLPTGKPTLSITTKQLSEDFTKAIEEMSEYNPLDYLRLLKFFEPTDRARLLQLSDWDKFAVSVSHIQKDSEASLIAEAAREALGVENARNLAFNFSKMIMSRAHQQAAIRLTGGLPLTDISGIFTQYANIARAKIGWPTEGDDAWIDFFCLGMHSLYICTMTNKDTAVVPAETATEILAGILNEDMLTIARRITKPDEALRGVYMMGKIREYMTEPDSIDKLMSYFGYHWKAYQEPEKNYDGVSQGKYEK